MCSSPAAAVVRRVGLVAAVRGLPPDPEIAVAIGLKRNAPAVVRPGWIAVVAVERRPALP